MRRSVETFGLDDVQVRVHGDAAVVTARQTDKGAYQRHPVPEAVRSFPSDPRETSPETARYAAGLSVSSTHEGNRQLGS
ncbi:MAG: hypothetical protein ACRDZ4_08060 [Egibacteraceae bacterium]